MKISRKNPYVFGTRGGTDAVPQHVDACAMMRKFSVSCGATHPKTLRGTQLRKHIATVCVSLNLSEHQVTDLANYMGHAEKIHKDIYRQPLASREILGRSKLLERAQGANDEMDNEDDDEDNTEDEDDPENGNDEDADSAGSSQRTRTGSTIRKHFPETSQASSNAKLEGSAKRKRFCKLFMINATK